jgi:quinoprotein glucose dehydrogenase
MPPGHVRGYDVETGALKWVFHTIPRPGEFGNETWLDGSWEYTGNTNVWSMMSCDEELGWVYLPLSTPTNDWYGGHRPGDGLFAESLVALDAKTGERKWHFQAVHHGVWDYDFPCAPNLVDITVDGKKVKAVAQVSKQGFTYVFDRVTGEPVWPIVERPVPQSAVPGERTSPTQPHPTKPPPFERQGVTEDDLIDFTPELRARALALIEPYEIGPIFTPPSLVGANGKQGTLMRPGIWGSANWHTGAFDPETGYYYAVSHMLPDVFAITPTSTPEATMRYHGFEELDSRSPRIDGLPIFKPPYGRITAIDMNRGEHAWMVANGDGLRNHPLLAGLDVGPLGVPGRAAPLVTSTLLFIAEGSDAVIGTTEDMWGLGFRAYDKATGAVIWKTELDAGATAAPMTYMHEGTQYIVMAIGGNGREAEWIALALR